MTTLTIDKELLEQVVNKLLTCWPKSDPLVNELRAALAAPATAPERKPMTDEEVIDLVRECGLDWHKGFMPLFDDDPTNRFAVLVRAVEASHGIKDKP